MNLQDIKAEVQHLDPTLKRKDRSFRTAVILLASVTNDLKTSEELRDFTKYQLRECYTCLKNLRSNGLGWRGDTFVHSGWDDKETGGVAFWIDVAVANGQLVTVRSR